MIRRRPNLYFDRLAGLYIWVVFLVVFGVWERGRFLSLDTFHSVASQQAPTAILGIAVVTALAAGAYDLSAGVTMNLTTVVAVWLQSSRHVPMVPAIVIAIAVGVLIGAVNAVLVVVLKLNSFIATLGTASVIAATQTIIVGATQPYPPNSTTWPKLTAHTVGGLQLVVYYLLIIAVVIWWVLARTRTGRYIYAIGGNAEAARLAGVPVGRNQAISLVTASTVAGIGGVMYGSLYGPSLTYGQGLLLPAFAAAFLGSILMRGRFNVWGTVAAVYILATGVEGLQLATSAQWLTDMFNGIALIAAVAFAMWRQRAAAARRAAEQANQGMRRTDVEDLPRTEPVAEPRQPANSA